MGKASKHGKRDRPPLIDERTARIVTHIPAAEGEVIQREGTSRAHLKEPEQIMECRRVLAPMSMRC